MANIATMSVSLVADVNKLVKGYEKAEKATTKFVSGVKTAIGILATGAVFNQLKDTILETVNAIDTAGKTAAKLGVTVETLQELDFVASQAGIEMKTMETALQRIARRSAEAAHGTGEAVKAFERLNLNAAEIAAMSADKQFEAVAKAMEGIANQNERIALAQKLFDTEGVILLQAMEDGVQGIIDKRKEAQGIGLFSSADAKRAAEFNDALDKLQRTVGAALRVLVTDNIDALVDAVNALAAGVTIIAKGIGLITGTGRAAGETLANMAVPTRAGVAGSAFSTVNTVDADLQRRLLQNLDRRVSREGPSQPNRLQAKQLEEQRRTNSILTRRQPESRFPSINLAPVSGL